MREWVKRYRFVNLIAATADDARDIMIEGESGILAICPRHERPYYRTSKSRLEWPNGARSLIFTADEPERLRGKQHMKLWADELAAWRYCEDAWDQAMFGLRLGDNPQAIVTTTPKPIPEIKALVLDPTTHITKGTTYDNRDNLAPAFYSKIIAKYEGSRLGRQELRAEILTDNPRALWSRDNIDATRVNAAPATIARVVVGLDPNTKNRTPAANKSQSMTDLLDEAGIVVACIGDAPVGWQPLPGAPADDTHFYIVGDYSLDEGPDGWSKAAVKAYRDCGADLLVGEVNNGGDMIESTIHTVDRDVTYKSVTATRGKAIRAEPVSALYAQGRVHHVGSFAALEDEMCDFDPLTTTKSPNRMDALVWALTELADLGEYGFLDFMKGEAARVATLQAPAHAPNVPRTETGWH